jgi:hypothetical protein
MNPLRFILTTLLVATMALCGEVTTTSNHAATAAPIEAEHEAETAESHAVAPRHHGSHRRVTRMIASARQLPTATTASSRIAPARTSRAAQAGFNAPLRC